MTHADPITYRTYRPGDEDAIIELFSKVFLRPWSRARWSWRHMGGPLGPSAIYLAESGGQLIGHMAGCDIAAFFHGKRVTLRVHGDLMVHPDWQGRGIFGELARMAVIASAADIHLHTPAEWWSDHVRARTSGLHLGAIPQWTRVLDTQVAPVGSSKLRFNLHRWLQEIPALGGSVSARNRVTVEAQDLTSLGEESDELARRSGDIAPMIVIRDEAYLRWRWADQPDHEWKMVAARDDPGAPRGFAIFGIDPGTLDDEFRVGRITDFIALDPVTTTALMAEAAQRLARSGCHLVTLDLNDPRPWSKRACYRAGFLPRGKGPHALVGKHPPGTAGLLGRAEAWYLTRGDTDLI